MSVAASRKVLYFVGGLLALVILSLAGLRLYFERNKARIMADLNAYITEHINGTMRIGSIDFQLLTGFPTLSLSLTDIDLKDLAGTRPLLKAKEIDVGLNVMRLFHHEIDVQSIVIDGATIDLFTDENGVTNSDIFKPTPRPRCRNRAAHRPRFESVTSSCVTSTSRPRTCTRRSCFTSWSSRSTRPPDYEPDGLRADLKLKVVARNMTFLAVNGSFIKDQEAGRRREGRLFEVDRPADGRNARSGDRKGLVRGQGLVRDRQQARVVRARHPNEHPVARTRRVCCPRTFSGSSIISICRSLSRRAASSRGTSPTRATRRSWSTSTSRTTRFALRATPSRTCRSTRNSTTTPRRKSRTAIPIRS